MPRGALHFINEIIQGECPGKGVFSNESKGIYPY